MRYSKWIGFVLAMGLTVAIAGCQQTDEMGKSARGLYAGETETALDRTPDQVGQAIVAIEKDLKLVRVSESEQSEDGQDEWTVVLRTQRDVKVEIVYTKLSERFTEVEISTGPFGDSALRQSIYDAMRSRLGLLPSQSEASADWSLPNGN